MWDGFSEADIERLKAGECPARGQARRQPTHLRGSARKTTARERLVRLVPAGGDLPDAARLSAPKAAESKTQANSSHSVPKDEDKNLQPISKPDSKGKDCVSTTQSKEKIPCGETSSNQGPVCIKIKEGKNYEVLSSEKTLLDEFQSRHKLMEEQNRRRKELLAKALADRKKKTHAEARRLQQIQEELQKLDALLSNDVGILRNQIEAASLEFMDAQKRYDKAEKEFLEAKLNLFGKLERKELLTEHLCKIIEQNEMRKAKKLSELMDKLEIENLVENTEEEQKSSVGSMSRQSDPSLKSSEDLKNPSNKSVQSSIGAPTECSADPVEDSSSSTATNEAKAGTAESSSPGENGDKLIEENV